jgi:hypothetical protein
VRALPLSANITDTDIAKRAEVNDDGVVMDYLWEQGNQDLWTDTFFDASDFDQVAASTAASFLIDNQSEVSCADVIVADEGSSSEQGFEEPEDTGIVAFGWNNAPFSFDGRSAGWLADCSNPLS